MLIRYLKKKKVLDLGSGEGIDLFLAESYLDKNGKVTGVDFSNKMYN